MSSRRLLVYGTLKEGRPLDGEGWELPELVTVERGIQVPGLLYDVGAYPAAVVDHGALVGGISAATFLADLVEIPAGADLVDALRRLDVYEEVDPDTGEGKYRRVFVDVAGGAWIYDWASPLDGLVLIESGEW